MTSNAPTDEPGIQVRVELGSRSYAVQVVSGRPDAFSAFVQSALAASWGGRGCRKALIVADENVVALEEVLRKALEGMGITSTLAVVPAGEGSKSLDRAADLFDDLVRMRADRHTLVVALGGGVIGDLAGFVAASYARGLPLFMIPTTLLSQVDSSVGGKVGINHPRAKNIIGSFHQPVGVWIDTETLKTLSNREYRCGLAEVIKYGVILDAEFFAYLEQASEAILAREPGALRKIVANSCKLKADVVSRDEREETGLRAVLNFGHTIGHAIEAVAGYGSQYHHGEAVAVGMVLEARLAVRLGWIGSDEADRIEALIHRLELPVAAPGLDPDQLLDAMTRDKKNHQGKIRFVLPRKIGRVELTDVPTIEQVRELISPPKANAG